MGPLDDQFARAARGDCASFDELMRAQLSRVLALVRRIVLDPALAEDVAQDVFLKVLEGKARLRRRDAAASWLNRVATRAAIDALRRERTRRKREEKHAMDARVEQLSAAERLVSVEENELLERALAELAPEDRAALWLHVVEGEGVREIARTLRTSAATISRRIRKTLDRLQRSLAAQGLAVLPVVPLEDWLRRLPSGEASASLVARIAERAAAGSGGATAPRPGPPAAGAPRWTPSVTPRARTPAVVRRAVSRGPSLVWISLGLGLVGAAALLVGWRLRHLEERRGFDAPAVVRAPEAAPLPDGAPPPVRSGTDRAGDEATVREEVGVPIGGRVVLAVEGSRLAGVRVQSFTDITRRVRDEGAFDALSRWDFVPLLDEILAGAEPSGESATDERGEFSLRVAQPGAVHLVATRQRADQILLGAARARAGDSSEPIVIEAARAFAIDVRVRNPFGGPRPDTQLAVIPDPVLPFDRDFTSFDFERLLDEFIPLYARTGADGRTRIVLPGDPERQPRRLLLRHPEHPAHHVLVREPASDLEVALRPLQLVHGTVVVTPPRAVDARLLVLPAAGAPAGWFAIAVSEAGGNFRLDAAGGESCTLYAKVPGIVFARTAEWDGDPSGLPLAIHFDGGGKIQGMIRGPDGKLLAAGVRVVCRDLQGAFISAVATTDAFGGYAFEGIPLAATCSVIVDLAGYYPAELLAATPTADEPVVRHDIQLREAISLYGTVTDPDGKPLPGTSVEVLCIADSSAQGLQLRWRQELVGAGRGVTDGSGAFVLDGIMPGAVTKLWAYHPEWGEYFSAALAPPPAGVLEVPVVLGACGIDVRFERSDGRAVEDVLVSIVSQTIWDTLPTGMNLGQWLQHRTSLDISRYRSDEQVLPGYRGARVTGGQVVWRDLEAAGYQLSFHRDLLGAAVANWDQEYWLRGGTLSPPLGPREIRAIRVVIDERRAIAGRVVLPDGSAPEPLRVQVYFEPDPLPGMVERFGYTVTHSREDGSFSAAGLGLEPYRVTFGDRADRLVVLEDVAAGSMELRVVYDPQNSGEKRQE